MPRAKPSVKPVTGPAPVINSAMVSGPIRFTPPEKEGVTTTETLSNSVFGNPSVPEPVPHKEILKDFSILLTEEIFPGAKGKVLEIVEQDDNSLFYLDESGSKWAVSRNGKGRFWEESK